GEQPNPSWGALSRLDLPVPHLWPRPLEGAGLVEPIPAAKGHDVIALGSSIQRLRGADGTVVWEKPLDKGQLAESWRSYSFANLVLLGRDLLWVSRMTPTLLCQSGQTGDLSWAHALAGPMSAVPGKPGTGAVCGLPQVIDEDVIALFYLVQA